MKTEELRKDFKNSVLALYELEGKVIDPTLLNLIANNFDHFCSIGIEAAERRRTEEVIEEVESLHYIKKVDRDCVTSALRSKFLKNPEQ